MKRDDFFHGKNQDYERSRFGRSRLAQKAIEAFNRLVMADVEMDDLLAIQKHFWRHYHDDTLFDCFLLKVDYLRQIHYGKIGHSKKTLQNLSQIYNWTEIGYQVRDRFHRNKNYRQIHEDLRELRK